MNNPSQADFTLAGGFPTLPDATALPGIVTLGTIDSNGVESGGISIPDAGLRNATVLALSASGNLYGTIDVGQPQLVHDLFRRMTLPTHRFDPP